MNIIRFLPSYVGSKSHWVDKLTKYQNLDFIEPFCGSAVISANLAKTAVLNDTDPVIYKVFSQYDQLICPDCFTSDDYEAKRWQGDWWRYLYCLQKMSFSGVFRYSKNGYNVPIKNVWKGKSIAIRPEFDLAQQRMLELNPTVLNLSYDQIDYEHYRNRVIVLDPPYEGSQANYNTAFDYSYYWSCVEALKHIGKVLIIFDRLSNLEKHNYKNIQTRKMVVNGSRKGDIEAMTIIE